MTTSWSGCEAELCLCFQLSRSLRSVASRARDDYVIEWLPAVEYVELYVYKHFFSVIASHRPEEQHTLVRSTGLELGVFSDLVVCM